MARSPASVLSEPETQRLQLDREKWGSEVIFRQSELSLRERELALRENEHTRSRWNNPLTIAIIGAAVAGLANAGVTWLNGDLARRLEEQKSVSALSLEERRSEASRILEAIRIGSDPDKAATNLRFLVDAGLLTDDTSKRIVSYLTGRKPGEGAALPTAAVSAQPQPRLQDFRIASVPDHSWVCTSDTAENMTASDLIDRIPPSIISAYSDADVSMQQRNFKDGEQLSLDIYLPSEQLRLQFSLIFSGVDNVRISLARALKSGSDNEVSIETLSKVVSALIPGCRIETR